MKKLSSALVPLLVLFIWGAFSVSQAQAQSGHFVILSQSNQASSTGYMSGGNPGSYNDFYADLGTGLTGSTTGAYVSADWQQFITSPSQDIIGVELLSYTNSNYSGYVDNCVYSSYQVPVGIYAASTTLFTQLAYLQGTGCNLNSSYYYRVHVYAFAGTSAGHTYTTALHGVASYDKAEVTSFMYPFFPQFAVVGDGFQIYTPSSDSSGVFFSGASAFCNAAFASSTGIGSYIGNGLCLSLGYLFIPTGDSMQQYADATFLKTKIPFSYFYNLADLYSAATASSSSNFVDVSIDYSNVASNTLVHLPDHWHVFSTSTIATYINPTLLGTFRGLMVMAEWLGFALYLWRRITRMKGHV